MMTKAQLQTLRDTESMRATELAQLLGMDESTVRRWGRDGTVRRVKVGSHWEYVTADVTDQLPGVLGAVDTA